MLGGAQLLYGGVDRQPQGIEHIDLLGLNLRL